jgi:serine/threonine protein kinase
VATSLVGRTLGSYQITDLLGQGGMATVYKGYREDIDRYVAVKVLPPHPGLDQQFIERFKLEAKTIARLQHPHILPLYDYGVTDDILYLVMAYIEGGSLAGQIHEGGMRPKEAERILKQVAGALDYAHRQGIIHRDIKPDNILMDKEGNALLADFGIAKIAEGGSNLTGTGGLVGTPAYMAPEQGRGDTITSSADIYSLGVVVFEMLSGRKPFSAETPMQVVIKHMTAPVPNIREHLPDVSPGVEAALTRALAKMPDDRYATATEFAEAFTRAVHSPDSLAGLKIDFGGSPDDTVIYGAPGAPTPPPPIPTQASSTLPNAPQPGTTTIIQQAPGYNPLVLLGGFAIIAVLIVAVVVLVTRPDGQSSTVIPTATIFENADFAITTQAETAQAVAAVPTAVPEPTFGKLSFSTREALGDTVTLQVQNLVPPGSGEVYVAWLQNTATGDTLALGQLTLDALGSGVLPPYTDVDGRPLPLLYNAVSITREDEMGDTPAGAAAYTASVPTELTDALRLIFETSPDGLGESVISASAYSYGGSDETAEGGPTVGLLASALAEAEKASQHAGLASNSRTLGGMHTHNEHTINIVLGTEDDYNGDARGDNPGFKRGILVFVDLMEAQLDAAANAEGSSRRLQADLELIRVCLENTRVRAQQVIDLEKVILAAEDVESVAQQALEATNIAGAIINGVDSNGNGQIEPFEGECGLTQVETFGLLVSTLTLVEAG